MREHRIGSGSADVIEIGVDAIWASVAKSRREIRNGFIIDRGVET